MAPWIMGMLKDATGSFHAGFLGLAAMLVVSASLTGVLGLATRER